MCASIHMRIRQHNQAYSQSEYVYGILDLWLSLSSRNDSVEKKYPFYLSQRPTTEFNTNNSLCAYYEVLNNKPQGNR